LAVSSFASNPAFSQSPDVQEVIKETKKLEYCANLLTEMSRQQGYGNYNQVKRLNQQYAYYCGR
jgi:hypothetical protein